MICTPFYNKLYLFTLLAATVQIVIVSDQEKAVIKNVLTYRKEFESCHLTLCHKSVHIISCVASLAIAGSIKNTGMTHLGNDTKYQTFCFLAQLKAFSCAIPITML